MAKSKYKEKKTTPRVYVAVGGGPNTPIAPTNSQSSTHSILIQLCYSIEREKIANETKRKTLLNQESKKKRKKNLSG